MMWGWWQHPTYVNVDPKTYTTPHEHIAKEMLNYRTTMGEELKNVDAQALPQKWKKVFDHLKEVIKIFSLKSLTRMDYGGTFLSPFFQLFFISLN
jgi:hypothetical protein